MKPKVLEQTSFIYDGVVIVVKLIQWKGKVKDRYFLYSPGFPNAGGYGFKTIESLWQYFQWWKSFKNIERKHNEHTDTGK